MTDSSGSLERVTREVGQALLQTTTRLSPSSLVETLGSLGRVFPAEIATATATAAAATHISDLGAGVSSALDTLEAAVEAGDEGAVLSSGLDLLAKCVELIAAFPTLTAALQSDGVSLGMDADSLSAFVIGLPERILQAFLVDHIDSFPGLGPTLTAVGIIDRRFVPSDPGDPESADYEQRTLRLDRLVMLFSDPAGLLQSLYAWGQPTFDATTLLDVLYSSATLFGLPARLRADSGGTVLEVLSVDVGLEAPTATLPPGIRIVVVAPLGGETDVVIPISLPQWTLTASFVGSLGAGWLVRIRPPLSIEVVPPGGALFTGSVGLTLGRDSSAGPLLLLGQTGATRLEADGFSFSFSLEASAATSGVQLEPAVALALDGVRFKLALGDADGFVRGVAGGGDALTAEFTLHVSWSASRGVQVQGSASLEIDVGVHADLGIVSIPSVHLSVALEDAGFDATGSAEIDASLGPVTATVRGLGIGARFQPTPSGTGTAGPVDASVEFRAPNGLGLVIDAGPVSGGGFLAFDDVAKRYAGAAQLDVYGIAVRAVGIVDTILPDGSDGYSFLLLITTEFTPIQLGFGFTLNGVGGLVGIQRTLDTDALRAGVRDGSVDHILFPADPVRDAASLIPDLQRIFPAAADTYVFGPMFKLGYGTPTLVEAELGAILKVPDPVLVVLGTVSTHLPTKDAAIVVLNLDVLGILDFGQKLLSIDASLRDSRVAAFAVSGDMAMRLSWGDDPSFALSIGGLNPHFQPPPNFPTLRRVSISAGDGDNPRLSFEAYLALTSNSLQFGARVSLYAEVVGISVEGYIGFDALVIFSPFSFRFDFAAGLAIKAFGLTLAGVTVEGTLEGPTPWHVRGHASISVLFFEASVDFDARFGDEDSSSIPTLAAGDAIAQVVAALQVPANWAAALPEGLPTLVSFGASATAPDTVRLDPLGTLTVRQKVAPLDRAITKLGGSPLAPSPLTIALESVQLGSAPVDTSPTVVTDHFAPGQFEDLSDSDQLSRPSFEVMDAGVTFGVDAATTGATQDMTLMYETIRADLPSNQMRGIYRPSSDVTVAQTLRGPVATSPATRGGMSRFAPPPASPPLASSLGDGTYVVASADTLALRADITTATAYGDAANRLAAYLVGHPAERGQLQVVPSYEAV